MHLIDWVIVAFAVALAVIGFRQGFVVGFFSLGGFVLGAIIGTRVVPLVLSNGDDSPYRPMFALMGAFLGGVILATGLEGIGNRIRHSLRGVAVLRPVDGALGAGLSASLALLIAWLAGAVALQTPAASNLRRDVQRSAILRRLNDLLPPSGGLLDALARIDPFPSLDGPAADVPAPTPRIARDPQVAGAAASVVKIVGSACGLGLEGSGWVAGDGLVVTNAHVIAGESDTTVQVRGKGPRFDATPVHVDSTNDIAILRVDNLQGVPALPLGDPSSGRSGAVLGFPKNGPYDVRPARLASTNTVRTDDAYGNGPVARSITSFRALVRPGNSGGPLVDGSGKVLATVFATARGTRVHTGYGVPNAIVRDALAAPLHAVSAGPCAP